MTTPPTPDPTPVVSVWAVVTGLSAAVLGVTGLALGPHGLGLAATGAAVLLGALTARTLARTAGHATPNQHEDQEDSQ